jgi:C_GCAxxG_C_C family probable redox protein
MIEAVARASGLNEAGYSCSQSVFASFAPGLGLDEASALRVAAAFGGGMGRMGEVCGAVSAALMALGLRYAALDPTDLESKEHLTCLAREFAERFRQNQGTLLCRELLGCDMNDPAAVQAAKEQGVFKARCPGFIQNAAEILAEMI